jgi:hypothetical protein
MHLNKNIDFCKKNRIVFGLLDFLNAESFNPIPETSARENEGTEIQILHETQI